jgi:hypothetical protein
MNERPWETELEQFLQSKLTARNANQAIGRWRDLPPWRRTQDISCSEWKPAYSKSVRADASESVIHGAPDHSDSYEVFGIFTSEPGTAIGA